MTHDDPIAWLEALLARAGEAEDVDPSRAALATVSAEGMPSVRFVLVREVGPDGLAFYTNYESDKARDLAANPHAALGFHWWSIGHQVRAQGEVQRVPPARSDAYFASRPRGSQIGAWASPQSRPLDSREALLAAVHEAERRFEGGDVPRPPSWGGYLLVPSRMEIWINGEDRLHDRFRFTRAADGWSRELLAP